MRKRKNLWMLATLFGVMCLLCTKVQAQVKVCMNYADFKADNYIN